MKTALYPGSFDPITNGHINLIERGLRVFDKLIVAVARNISKKGLFSTEERLEMIRESVDTNRVEAVSFEGLLVEYAKNTGATVILRGLRAVSDFDYEFQMTHMNRLLAEEVETVFMMTGDEYFYVSSQLVREVASFGGKVEGLVPPTVEQRLIAKFEEKA